MSEDNQTQPLSRQTTNIAMAVSFYWVVSIAMVFANKTLLGNQDRSSAPIFITWTQCVTTVIFCYVAGKLQILNVPPFEIKLDILKQMLSLSGIFTSMIILNNFCLKYVELSFYQVARSLTIVFNVIFGYIILNDSTSISAMVCCAILVAGFTLGNIEEVHWSLVGAISGVASSFFIAMNSIYVKKKFALVENDPWKLTLYNNVNASILFLPLILITGEVPVIISSEQSKTLSYWLLLFFAGLLGVSISFATAAQIKYTSPLTHNVSAAAKSTAQTVIALMVYKNPITALGGVAICIVLFASLGYAFVRRAEMQKREAERAAAQEDVAEENLIPAESKTDRT